MSTDRFGIPDSMFGPHDDDFYGAMGRLALLASLLEHHVRTIARKLVVPDANGHDSVSIARVITQARKGLRRFERADDRQALDDFLTRAKTLMARRNIYLHSIWPAQPDGSLFGWKSEPWESSERIGADDIHTDILELVDLNARWHRVWPLVSARLEAGVGEDS